MQSRSKLISYVALFTACGILFGYIEFLVPLPIGIPGVKIGLSNIITVCSMYLMGPVVSLIILVLRVVLSGLLFGNLFGILYGLSGALISFLFMYFAKKINIFSVFGLSVLGGVMHNIAQLVVATILISQLKLIYYLPALLISGVLAGLAVGFLSRIIINRIKFLFTDLYLGEL